MKKNLIILTCSCFLMVSCIKRKCPEPVSVAGDTPQTTCTHIVTKWNPEKSISTNDLYTSFFINSTKGWASGANGTILKTVDAGQNWSVQNSNTTQGIYAMYFLNDNLGYATGGDPVSQGGVVLKTIDGGQTWNVQLNITPPGRTIYFIDSNTGFVGGSNGSLVKTIDGGQTWSTINSSISGAIYKIQFIDATIGYLSGAKGEIYKTIDGGNSWTYLPTTMPTGLNDAYYSMSFISKDSGYVCGYSLTNNSGYLIKTVNGGQNWTYLASTAYYLLDIKMIDMNTGYVVGGINGSFGNILKITNGTSWNIEQTLPLQQTGLARYGCNTISVGRGGSTIIGE